MRSLIEQKLAELEIALSLIPECDKVDYLKALQVAPDLIGVESDPVRFLRFANFNPMAAALGVIRYWKLRRETLGNTKAFLPLSLTGEGALDGEVIDFVRSGVSFAPLLMENELSQTEGIVAICILENMQVNHSAYYHMKSCMSAFPVNIKRFHWVYMTKPEDKKMNNHVLARVRNFVWNAYPRLLRGGNNFVAHSLTSQRDIAGQLEIHGIDKANIPVQLGGEWSYWQLQEWIEKRITRDRVVYGENLNVQHHLNNLVQEQPDVCRLPLKKRLKPTFSLNTISPNGVGGKPELTSISTTFPKSDFEVENTEVSQEALKQALDKWHLSLLQEKHFTSSLHGTKTVQFFWRYLHRCVEKLPDSHKAAVMDAAKKAPCEIWRDECNPFMFLSAEDFDNVLAAKRLGSYWQIRSNVFGESKYCCMHQTGEGALKRKTDVVTLETGFAKLLPSDTSGCSVVFLDPSRLLQGGKNHTIERVRRCLFYVFSLVSENASSQKQGASIIIWIPSINSLNVVMSLMDFLLDLWTSLPFRIKAMHLMFHGMKRPVTNLHRIDELIGEEKLFLHDVSDLEDIPTRLAHFGYQKKCLPRSLNGDWGEQEFTLWQELRTRVEWKVPQGLCARDTMEVIPAIPLTYELMQDKAERLRRLSIIHSRKKRIRKHLIATLLEEECTNLHNERKRLREENQVLEELLQQAFRTTDVRGHPPPFTNTIHG